MTDNTQPEHMNNSGQSTPYAQGSAQAELDHIVVDNSLDVIFDKMGYTKNTDFRKEAIRLIADWHNKRIEAVLDRLIEQQWSFGEKDDALAVPTRYLIAERNKLKESK